MSIECSERRPFGARTIKASEARVGLWLIVDNPRMNRRIVGVAADKHGVKMATDFGNGGEPATEFFQEDEQLLVGQYGQLAVEAGERYLVEVLESARGFFLGTRNEEGMPFSRESRGYFPTREAADAALHRGTWLQNEL